MNREQWDQVKQLLDQAIALDAAERPSFLDRSCHEDSEIRREIESLLASHEQAGTGFLKTSAADLEAAMAPATKREGHRIGVYQILREIGHGGMGEVYRAVRADGQYTKEVAIKLVRGGCDSRFVQQRFLNERQILATLDHPNIAHLLDGGTTEDGVPYLVMELIEGEPIDTYCDDHKLSITDRLHLFHQACAAVQYAHQRLVIHRDLKPSNILVTRDGVPKLLDFGIAKILDPAEVSAETTLARPMTPEYASPEQIRGEPITTASDVYSLGVVLYQLLTGRSPYRSETASTHELARAICDTDPGKPSTVVSKAYTAYLGEKASQRSAEEISNPREGSPAKLRRRLSGDLDNIVLTALRKEPQRRYASVEQFAEDIRRHLEGLPVTATKGSWSYRTSKFVTRHKLGMAATALVLLAVAAGVVATVHEARVAAANARRAEKRFNDVRKLANSLMFEIHDSVQDLPGATDARKLIMQRSLEYLDSLAMESGNDPALLRELAAAYGRIGMLQGTAVNPNLGDTKSAMGSLQKAIQIRESLVRLHPIDSNDQVELAVAYLDYSDFQRSAAGNMALAYDYGRKAVSILDREAASSHADARVLSQAARAYENLGIMQVGQGAMGWVGTIAGGIADLQKSLVFTQRAIQSAPSSLKLHAIEAAVNALLGDAQLKLGNREQALVSFRHALDTLEALNAQGNNIRVAANVTVVMQKIGDVLLLDGKYREATVSYAKAEQLSRQLAEADPHNELLRQNVVTSTAEHGYGLVQSGRTEEGLKYLRQAQETAAGAAQTPLVRTLQGVIHVWTGEALEHEGRILLASYEYRKSEELLRAVSAAGTDDAHLKVYLSSSTNHVAASLAKLGRLSDARDEYAKALTLLEPLFRTNPEDAEIRYALADTYTGEGTVAARLAERAPAHPDRLAEWKTACDWYQKSLDTWSKVSNPSRISFVGFETVLPEEVSRRFGECNAQIGSLTIAAKQPR